MNGCCVSTTHIDNEFTNYATSNLDSYTTQNHTLNDNHDHNNNGNKDTTFFTSDSMMKILGLREYLSLRIFTKNKDGSSWQIRRLDPRTLDTRREPAGVLELVIVLRATIARAWHSDVERLHN